MANSLPPDLLAQLQARGILPPPAPPPATDWRAKFAAGAPPPAPPAPPRAPPSQEEQDAIEAAQAAATTPEQASSGIAQPLGAPSAPVAPPANRPPSTPADAGRAEGVFAPQRGAGAGGIPSVAPLPGQGAGGVVAAHGVPLVSPENRSAILGAGAEQAGAAGELGRAQVGANEQSADSLHRQAVDVALEDVQQRAKERERKRVIDSEFAQLHQLNEEAANGKIDPDRWWNGKSGGQKALAMVGLFLGELGQGLTRQGGPSAALQIINKHVDDDIASQRESLAGKRDAAKAQQSLLGQKMAAFGDERSAEAAARITRLEQYKLMIDAEAKRAQSPVIAAQARMGAAAIRQEQARLAASLEKWQPAMSTGGASGPTPAQIAAETSKIYEASKGAVPPDQARRIAVYNLTGRDYGSGPLPAGWGGAGGAQDRLGAFDAAIGTLRQLDALGERGATLSPEQRALGQTLLSRAVNEIPRAEIGTNRAPSEQEQKLIREQLGENPAEIKFTGGDRARIKETLRALEERRRAAAGEAPAPDVSRLQKPVGE